MSRLSKRDVEQLLDCYDSDPAGALAAALVKLGANQKRDSLDALDTADLDALLRDLVEWRGLTPPSDVGP